eukprot:gene18018-24428_t
MRDGPILVFVNTIAMADKLHRQLQASGCMSGLMHSALSQTQREEGIECLKYGVTPVLVATGSISRGVHIPDIAHVVNFDVPRSIEDYIQRVGRTGRAGRKGSATTFYTPKTDSSMAGDLVNHLESVFQEQPQWLKDMAVQSSKVQKMPRGSKGSQLPYGSYVGSPSASPTQARPGAPPSNEGGAARSSSAMLSVFNQIISSRDEAECESLLLQITGGTDLVEAGGKEGGGHTGGKVLRPVRGSMLLTLDSPMVQEGHGGKRAKKRVQVINSD